MVDTSKDILYITIAVCVAIFTFFTSWALFYIVMILKKGNDAFKQLSTLISSVKEKVEKIEHVIDIVEEKVTHSASYLPLLFKGVTELLDFFKKKKEKSKQKKSE
jgi:hypothetical protein